MFESKIYGQYCIQGKEIFDWESVGDFLVDGALKVEARVNVIDSVLIPKQQTLKGDVSHSHAADIFRVTREESGAEIEKVNNLPYFDSEVRRN